MSSKLPLEPLRERARVTGLREICTARCTPRLVDKLVCEPTDNQGAPHSDTVTLTPSMPGVLFDATLLADPLKDMDPEMQRRLRGLRDMLEEVILAACKAACEP